MHPCHIYLNDRKTAKSRIDFLSLVSLYRTVIAAVQRF